MNTKIAFLVALALSPLTAVSECRVVARDYYGREIVECNRWTEPLPICGSEYDTGNRCVVRNPPPRYDRGRRHGLRGRGDGRAMGDIPYQGATGSTPFNAAGSWPNAAQRLGNERR